MPSPEDSNRFKADSTNEHSNGFHKGPLEFSPVHLILHLQEGVTIVFTNIDTYWKAVQPYVEDRFTVTTDAKDFTKEENIDAADPF